MAAAHALSRWIRREFADDPESTSISTPAIEAFEARRGVRQDFAHIMIAGLPGLGSSAASKEDELGCPYFIAIIMDSRVMSGRRQEGETSMTLTLLLGLVTFTFVASITPGPNNMMLLASGANFGLRRTLPHMAGISLGFGLMVLVVGYALAGIIAALPWLYEVLRWAGAGYLLCLAYKIGTSRGVGTKAAPQSPMTFWQAAAFQWVNPKALAMGVGAVTTYAARDHLYLNVALVALVVVVIGAPCITSWAAFGVGMRRVLNRPKTMRAFNIAMALLLVLSLYPMLTERLRP